MGGEEILWLSPSHSSKRCSVTGFGSIWLSTMTDTVPGLGSSSLKTGSAALPLRLFVRANTSGAKPTKQKPHLGIPRGDAAVCRMGDKKGIKTHNGFFFSPIVTIAVLKGRIIFASKLKVANSELLQF
jgi:hypothetical protein